MAGKRIHVLYKEYFVGGFLIAATLTLLALILATLSKNNMFEERYRLKAVYATKYDMSVGAKIKISGMYVGEVSDLYFTKDNKIELVLTLLNKYQHMIRENSRAELIQERFPISDRIINITLGSEPYRMLQDGMYITAKEPLNLDTVVQKLTTTVNDVSLIIGRIANGEGTVGKVLKEEALYNDIKSISGTAVTATRQVNGLLSQLNGTLGKVNQLMDSIAPIVYAAKGSMTEIQPTISRVQSLLDTLNMLLSKTSGLVDNVPGVMYKGEDAIGNVNDILGAVKKTWPISGKLEEDPRDPPIFYEAR